MSEIVYVNGWPAWVMPSGRLAPFIGGAEDDDIAPNAMPAGPARRAPSDPYSVMLNRVMGYYDQYDLLNEIWLGDSRDPDRIQGQLVKLGMAPSGPLVDALGNSRSAWDVLESALGNTEQRIASSVKQLYAFDFAQAEMDIGWRLTPAERKQLLPASMTGQSFAPAPYQFDVQANGDVVVFNPNNGSISVAGNFPGSVQKQVTQDRNGNLVSVNPFTGETQVLVEGFGFPEVDPALKFRMDTLAAAAQAEQSLAGIEMQRRSAEVAALGNDLARQVEIGSLVYTEAELRLRTVDNAFTQRREERAQALKYAVTRASLRTNSSGELVTRLPFADQISSILTSATGRQFNPSDFELGVGVVNPDQTAQDVINAGSFTSAIPGLQQARDDTNAKIAAILSQPAPASPATAAITQAAQSVVPGVR